MRVAGTESKRRPGPTAWWLALALAGCAGDSTLRQPQRSADAIRADIAEHIPATVRDRAGWATDLYAALSALGIEASDANVCAVLAVTAQESTFQVDPPVPNLAKIAREEIFKRADARGIPALAVRLALQLQSPNGKTYDERLAAVRTEGQMSLIYEDLIGELPLGKSKHSVNPRRRASCKARWRSLCAVGRARYP